MTRAVSLREIFSVFLRLGSTGFGGPFALISLMERECVEKRRWLTTAAFSESYVFCKLLPGPVAYQMALWLGHRVRGRVGGLIAGLSLLLPGFLMIVAIAAFYHELKGWRGCESSLEGIRAGALVVVLESALNLAKPYRKRLDAYPMMLLAAILMIRFPSWEPVWILAGGIGFILARRRRGGLPVVFPIAILAELFWIHFKAGLFVFGTGLAILPALETEVVRLRAWLPPGEFLDAVAFGQMTPGPITITSSFIGFRVYGMLGAVFATLGMYLPGTIMILVVVPLVWKRVKDAHWLVDFQDGAVPMVLGCLFGACYMLGATAVATPLSIGIAIFLAAVARTRWLPSWSLIPLGGLLSAAWKLAGL